MCNQKVALKELEGNWIFSPDNYVVFIQTFRRERLITRPHSFRVGLGMKKIIPLPRKFTGDGVK